jgi:hypothetical protein
MKSLRLRSGVFPLGFGRAPKLPLDPARFALVVDSILLAGVQPGRQHSGSAPRSAVWEYGDQRNRARNRSKFVPIDPGRRC